MVVSLCREVGADAWRCNQHGNRNYPDYDQVICWLHVDVFVALSIAPSHKREVFRGACFFLAAIAVVIAMMSAADGNPVYRMSLPFISAILACGVTRRFMRLDRFGTGMGPDKD